MTCRSTARTMQDKEMTGRTAMMISKRLLLLSYMDLVVGFRKVESYNNKCGHHSLINRSKCNKQLKHLCCFMCSGKFIIINSRMMHVWFPINERCAQLFCGDTLYFHFNMNEEMCNWSFFVYIIYTRHTFDVISLSLSCISK